MNEQTQTLETPETPETPAIDYQAEYNKLVTSNKDVTDRLAAYEGLGTMDTIKANATRIKQIDDYVKTAGEKKKADEAKAKAAERKFTSVEDEFNFYADPKLKPLLDRIVLLEGHNSASKAEKAMTHLMTSLKDSGYDVPDDEKEDVIRYINARLTDEDNAKLEKGDYSFVKGMLPRFKDSRFMKLFASEKKETPGLPKRHMSGGVGVKQGDAPKTIEDAGRQAKRLLASVG